MLAKATKAWEGGFPLRPWREAKNIDPSFVSASEDILGWQCASSYWGLTQPHPVPPRRFDAEEKVPRVGG